MIGRPDDGVCLVDDRDRIRFVDDVQLFLLKSVSLPVFCLAVFYFNFMEVFTFYLKIWFCNHSIYFEIKLIFSLFISLIN